MTLQPPVPMDPRPRLVQLQAALVELLRSLDPADWQRTTACDPWTAKDLAAHLLDDDLRRLSLERDGMTLGATGLFVRCAHNHTTGESQ